MAISDKRIEELKNKYSEQKMGDEKKGPQFRGPGGAGRFNPSMSGKPKDMKKTLLRLSKYVIQDSVKLGFVFLCVILGTIFSLIGSYMLRPIINNLVYDQGLSVLAKNIIFLLCVYLLAVFCQFLQQRIMISVSQNALKNLRDDFFNHVQTLPIKFFDRNSHGDIMSRFTNDVDTIGEMLTNTFVNLISGTVTIVGTFSLMVYTNFTLTVVTIVMIPLMIYAGQLVAKHSRKYFKEQQSAIGTLNGYIEETISGQRVVKVFCHEEIAIEEFEYLNDNLRQKLINAQFYGGVMGPIVGNLGQVSYALTTTLGALLCVLRGFDIGGLTIFVRYSRQFSRPLNEISMQVNTIFSAIAGAERVFAIMDTQPEENHNNESILNDCKGDISLNNVTFGYNKDKIVLKNISVDIKSGQKVAFVGSTGAGKTTITNLINRFYDIQDGEILIDGTNIKEINKDSLRKNIAMVLQDTHLFTGTIMENIRYGRLDATDEEVVMASKMSSAHSFIMRLEKGYDTIINGDGQNLSQGQRQLLNIARASISKARILVLDEATSSVDTRTEKHIEDGMTSLMKERTTLMIAHRLSTVRHCDKIIVLENGEIIESGNHKQLLEQKGHYYKLHSGMIELD